MSLRTVFGTVKQVFKETFAPRDITPTLTLLDFKNNHELEKVVTRCDQELGGYSTVNLDIARNGDNKCAHFHGNLNLDTPANNPKVMYSGWAMFRTKHKNAYQHKLFYLSDYFANFRWDFSPYQCMVLKCKIEPTECFTPSNSKDGTRLRSFFVNIQTDSASQTDLFQHRLFFQKPGQWETIIINLDDFVLTNRGRVLSQISGEMERERIKSIGIGITDGIYGPYSLYIDSIKVMFGVDLAQSLNEARNANNEKSK